MPVAIPTWRKVLLMPTPSRPLGRHDRDRGRGERGLDEADADAADDEAGQQVRPARARVEPAHQHERDATSSEAGGEDHRIGTRTVSRPAIGATKNSRTVIGRKRSPAWNGP